MNNSSLPEPINLLTMFAFLTPFHLILIFGGAAAFITAIVLLVCSRRQVADTSAEDRYAESKRTFGGILNRILTLVAIIGLAGFNIAAVLCLVYALAAKDDEPMSAAEIETLTNALEETKESILQDAAGSSEKHLQETAGAADSSMETEIKSDETAEDPEDNILERLKKSAPEQQEELCKTIIQRAEDGDVRYMLFLVMCYFDGETVLGRDVGKAFAWLEKIKAAAEAGNSEGREIMKSLKEINLVPEKNESTDNNSEKETTSP